MIKVPCRNCDHRYLGCHSKCKDYAEFRKQKDEQNDKIYKLRKESVDVIYTRFGNPAKQKFLINLKKQKRERKRRK